MADASYAAVFTEDQSVKSIGMSLSSKQRRVWWICLLIPAFVYSPLLWYGIGVSGSKSDWLVVTLFVGSCFGISLLYNYRDGARGGHLFTLSIATGVLAIAANAVVLFGIGFVGCLMTVDRIGKPAP